MPTMELDEAKARELEEKFDSEIRFRPLAPLAGAARRRAPRRAVAVPLLHGRLRAPAGDDAPRHPPLLRARPHLPRLPVLQARLRPAEPPGAACVRSASPLVDWVLAVAAVVAVLHVPLIPLDDLAFRVGNPTRSDVILGAVLIFVLLEATRRSVGWPLPIIALLFMVYAMLRAVDARHPGASRRELRAADRPPLPDDARASTASRSASSRPTSSTSCCSASSRPASASASCSSIAPPGSRGATPAGRRRSRSSARPCSA